ncbi:MAG: hypothetical protein IJ761_01180 [Bacteroidales bacterium]|nr:hypothetical protein [Bacteroidales bacterium]
MKKVILVCVTLIACTSTLLAQRQKVSVGKDGEMIVNGETVAYIEKEGCKLLSNTCMFTITDENDNLLMTITQKEFADKEYASAKFPNGAATFYLVFSFRGYEAVAEVDSPIIPKSEAIAKIIARWRLIKDKQLDPEAVQQFITANGTKFSEKERLQNQPPAIQIIQQ